MMCQNNVSTELSAEHRKQIKLAESFFVTLSRPFRCILTIESCCVGLIYVCIPLRAVTMMNEFACLTAIYFEANSIRNLQPKSRIRWVDDNLAVVKSSKVNRFFLCY